MSLLGGLPPARFLRDHWQKKPLLVRGALPGFRGVASDETILGLATRDDVRARLVIRHPGRRRGEWERHDGPFAGLTRAMLPKTGWTLLVNSLESLVPGGWELLGRVDFIPRARIDDLMVSIAADGGTVGPHDDQYDVFLLQGPGRRRWQIARGGERTHDPRAAIKVLAHFEPEEEWLCEPGDLLYLPPGVAHYGVAEGPCQTYSIGFRAPSHKELWDGFLGYVAGALSGAPDAGELLADPALRATRRPLALHDGMVDDVARVLDGIRWDRRLVEEFLGAFLTRPRPGVRFSAPARPPSPEALARRIGGRGRLRLALPTRGLVRGATLFLNGEAHRARPATRAWFEELVATRTLALPRAFDDAELALVHGWLARGWLTVERLG